jgi:hypothetical protein
MLIIKLNSTSVNVMEVLKGVCVLGPMLYVALVLFMLL